MQPLVGVEKANRRARCYFESQFKPMALPFAEIPPIPHPKLVVPVFAHETTK